MNKCKFIQLFFLTTLISCTAENKYSLYDDYKIKIADQISLWENISKDFNEQQKTDYQRGRYVFRKSLLKYDDIKNARSSMISEEMRALAIREHPSKGILEDTLKSSESYILIPDSPMNQVSGSYKKITIDQKAIGEQCFSVAQDGLLAPSAYSFSAYIIGKEGIIRFQLVYSDPDKDLLAKRMTKYFYQKDGEMYWKNTSAPDLLFRDIIKNSDTIPTELHLLYLLWENILSSLSE